MTFQPREKVLFASKSGLRLAEFRRVTQKGVKILRAGWHTYSYVPMEQLYSLNTDKYELSRVLYQQAGFKLAVHPVYSTRYTILKPNGEIYDNGIQAGESIKQDAWLLLPCLEYDFLEHAMMKSYITLPPFRMDINKQGGKWVATVEGNTFAHHSSGIAVSVAYALSSAAKMFYQVIAV